MKKYLTIAAVLGAIAFLSVSYLAKADTAAVPAAAVDATAAPAPGAPIVVPPAPPAAPGDTVVAFVKDHDMCNLMATAPTTEGAQPTADARDAAYKKCMLGKSHTEAELKKEADDKAAKDKAAVAPAPAAK